MPDSLGPRVAERVFVTRHIKEHMPEAFDFDIPSVCAIAPGVLGVTGGNDSDEISADLAEAINDCGNE